MLDHLRAAPLIDGHNDLLWELRQGRDPADPTLMTDLPRIATGGVGGQFWSVYVPSDLPADRAVTMEEDDRGARGRSRGASGRGGALPVGGAQRVQPPAELRLDLVDVHGSSPRRGRTGR